MKYTISPKHNYVLAKPFAFLLLVLHHSQIVISNVLCDFKLHPINKLENDREKINIINNC